MDTSPDTTRQMEEYVKWRPDVATIIHNDPNDMNIIVNKSDDVYSVAMIDFGDCMVSAYVFELAMAMAYSMCSKEDPVRFILPLLAGYLNAFSLPDSDLNCLYWAVLGRLAQSCANGMWHIFI